MTAIDFSEAGLRKAAEHAAERGVADRIEFRQADLRTWTAEGEQWDLVSSCFLHLLDHGMLDATRQMAAAVAPGGTLLVAGHHPDDEHTGLRWSMPGVMFTADELAPAVDADQFVVRAEARVRTRDPQRRDPHGDRRGAGSGQELTSIRRTLGACPPAPGCCGCSRCCRPTATGRAPTSPRDSRSARGPCAATSTGCATSGTPSTPSAGSRAATSCGPGGSLPPLLLEDDEAVAIAVGLRTTASGAVAGLEETSVQALTKVIGADAAAAAPADGCPALADRRRALGRRAAARRRGPHDRSRRPAATTSW